MNELQATNYVTIQGWMVTELGLKGNDLLVYAIIYGFSQLPGQCFEGSRQYLADWTGCSKQGIAKNLQNLVDKSLIVKEDYYVNNIKFCRYKALACIVPGNSVDGGGQLSCPNNNIYNNTPSLCINSNNISSLRSEILPEYNNIDVPQGGSVPKVIKFTPPIAEEVREFCMENNLTHLDPNEFIDFYESKGWMVGKNKMKSWQAAARRWDRENAKRNPRKLAYNPEADTLPF